MQKITPFLWFDTQAEEAAEFYTSVFRRSKITGITRYGPDAPGPEGSVMTVTFELEGQAFIALNGGPAFQFTPAISLVVHCKTQKELDRLWEKLSEGGEQLECGWLKDRYGMSWQIEPEVIWELLQDKDVEKARRAMEAVWKMRKIDIATLKRAHRGGKA